MLRRRLLTAAALTTLLAAPAAHAPAPAAAAQAAAPPAAAPPAASTRRHATFVRATGGAYTVPVHPGGLSIYPNSPAYVVLQAGATTSLVEQDGSTHNFPWVAVPDTRGGSAGLECFSNGHLVTAKRLVDKYSEDGVQYNGLFLQYSSRHFKAGGRKASDCAPAGSGAGLVPSIAVHGRTVNLHLDCLLRSCRGTLVAFGDSRLCAKPQTIVAGRRGCLPSVTGQFTISGGLSVDLKLPLSGNSLHSSLLVITLNGKRGPLIRLASLPRRFVNPPAPHRALLSVVCPTSGTLGSPVTVSGMLSPGGAPATVTLTFIGAGTASSTVTATTNTAGAFSARFTPTGGLVWVVDATFAGDRTRTHAEHACGFSLSP
jgi:hypothetical protein